MKRVSIFWRYRYILQFSRRSRFKRRRIIGRVFSSLERKSVWNDFSSTNEKKNLQIANKTSNSKFWNDFSSTNTDITVRLCFRLTETTFPDGVTILQRKKRGNNQLASDSSIAPSNIKFTASSWQVKVTTVYRGLSRKLKTLSCCGKEQAVFWKIFYQTRIKWAV